jgi:Capsule assembly protein Wzi
MCCLAAIAASNASARGVSPYLPLKQSPEIERKIERLLILAGEPVLTRPIAAATVIDALTIACDRDAALCADVRRYLSGWTRTAGIGYASLGLGAGAGADTTLPNRHGMTSQSDYELAAGVYFQPGDRFLVTGGVDAYEGEATPTGTLVSMGQEYFQLDVGYRDHWWSPFTDSAMTIGTQATTFPSVTISNYTPLSRWRFRYEAFVGEMSESAGIVLNGGTTTGNPRLAGLHLSIEPFRGWSLGVSRLLQYGGGGRPDGLRDLVDAFFNPSSKDNASAPGGDEFGNQVAAFSSRFVVDAPLPFAVYFEYAGEDTSTLSNLRLGNASLSAGIDFPSVWNRFALTFEVSEWQNSWYEHHIYRDGLRNEGHVLGHWGADWRQAGDGDGVGARSWLARLGWSAKRGGLVDLSFRTLANADYSSVDYDRGRQLDVRYSRPWSEFFVGGELVAGRDVFGESYSRVSAFIRF